MWFNFLLKLLKTLLRVKKYKILKLINFIKERIRDKMLNSFFQFNSFKKKLPDFKKYLTLFSLEILI